MMGVEAIMTTGNRVTGRVALALSQQFAVTLHKFADPVSGADDDMDLESEIIRECLQADPQLLWVDRHEAARAVAAATLIDCASDSLYVIASQAVCDADNAHDVRRIVADVCRIYREATEEAQNER
jgi:hypothetical protein